MRPFDYMMHPARYIFGSGTLGRLGEILEENGWTRALILSTAGQAETALALQAQVPHRTAGTFAHAAMHTPVEVSDRAVAYADAIEADCLVAIGGGSTTGLGKAIALRTDLPQIVIPTTYAGSEATPILGETVEGRKTTQRSPRILPEIVLYDIDLTLTLPVELSITSGFNAIAHAAEALYAPNGNPLIDGLAEQGITAMCRALPLLRRQPVDASARSDALYGAWACGMCLGATDMGLHHKLCHTLGGAFDLPHAEMHTVLLPHTLAYNSSAVPDAMRRIAAAASVADAPQGLFDLQRKLGAPQSLEALGMPFDGIAEAARLATENAYRNPREITSAGIEKLLSRAFAGNRPLSE